MARQSPYTQLNLTIEDIPHKLNPVATGEYNRLLKKCNNDPEKAAQAFIEGYKRKQAGDRRKTAGKTLTVDLSTPEKREEAVANGEAVKCLECGTYAKKLGYSHFNGTKCTGRFKSADEYKAAYPGAIVVPVALAKLTGGTLENYIKLHGKEEGQRLWDEYKGKQAYSNSLEYKQEKHGWTEEKWHEKNKERAHTLENDIKRYGVEEGNRRWEQYCKRQSDTTKLEYFVDKWGVEEGTKIYNNFDDARLHALGSAGASESELQCIEWLCQMLPDLAVGMELQHSVLGVTRALDAGWVERKKAIEFYGTCWHADPDVYSDPTQVVQPINKTAQEIWDKDARKISQAESAGYSVFVIWEREFKRKHLHKQLLDRLLMWWNS